MDQHRAGSGMPGLQNLARFPGITACGSGWRHGQSLIFHGFFRHGKNLRFCQWLWPMRKKTKKTWKKLRKLLSKKFGPKSYISVKREITELYDQGQLQKAATLAIKSIETYPSKFLLYFMAGNALRGLGHEYEKDACRYLSKALAICPDHQDSRALLTSTILTSRNLPELAKQNSNVLFKACAATDDRRTLNMLLRAVAPSEDLERAADELSKIYLTAGYTPEFAIGPIRTVRDWANLSHAPLLEVDEIETIPFREPAVYGRPASSDIMYGYSNKPYVAELSNVRVFSHSSNILTSEWTILNDDAGHERFGGLVSFEHDRRLVLRQRDRLLLDLTHYKERKIDAAVFLAGFGSENFGHWFPEFLPRIQFFRQHPEFEKLPIIVDADMPESHFQYLRGLVNNDFILMQADESLACNRLLIASSPTFLPVILTVESLKPHDVPGMSPRALQFLKDELSPPEAAQPHRRIFLARKNMQWRRLTNENEVAEALVKLGFEIVHLENIDAAGQIEIFQQAEWIVAPNGSALLNIVFASTSAKVLVLSQPNLFNWGAFQGPIGALGYRPLFVCGEQATDRNKKHSDYSVSPALVTEALEYMGLPLPAQNEGVGHSR